MNWNTVAWVGFIGLGTYVFGQAILFKWQLGAVDYWDVRGYINGIVKGAGNYIYAVTALKDWRDYWLSKGSLYTLVNHFYNYGLKRAQILYGG